MHAIFVSIVPSSNAVVEVMSVVLMTAACILELPHGSAMLSFFLLVSL